MTAATSTFAPTVAGYGDSDALVGSAASGDEAAFTAIYNRYAGRVYNMVLRSLRDQHLAEDVSQDVWLKAHRQLPKLREPSAFPAWLYRIAAKTCVDVARRRSASRESELFDDAAGCSADDPERQALRQDSARLVWQALAVLPPHQHLALFLREIEHRSYREISRIIGISETAVGLCLFRGRRAFLKEYERIDGGSSASCDVAQRLMSLRMDGESTVVQDHALDKHLEFCAKCRDDERSLRQTSRQYASLAMLPVPMLLHAKVTGAAALAVGAGRLAKTAAVVAAHIKHLLLAATLAGAVGGTAIVAPHAPGLFGGGPGHQRSTPSSNGTVEWNNLAVQTAAASSTDSLHRDGAAAAHRVDSVPPPAPPAVTPDVGLPVSAPVLDWVPGIVTSALGATTVPPFNDVIRGVRSGAQAVSPIVAVPTIVHISTQPSPQMAP